MLHSIIIIADTASPLPDSIGKYIGIFFPFAFVGMWIFISFIISRFGWIRFTRKYPSQGRPPGRVYSVPMVTFGMTGIAYRGIARAVATETGLYIYLMLLFRAFHPPFILPWSSIEKIVPYSNLWTRGYIIQIRNGAGSFQMYVSQDLEQELSRFIPHLLPSNPPAMPV
jgi:hypothetical protein